MDSISYIKRRISATYQFLLLPELSHIELACTVKTIKALSQNETKDLISLIETVKHPKWTIVNRNADSLILKIKKYAKKAKVL